MKSLQIRIHFSEVRQALEDAGIANGFRRSNYDPADICRTDR